MTYERDAYEGGVASQDETRRQGIRRAPFETLPAEDLVQRGFVRRVATDLVYYAPDADVLLSAIG